MPRWLRLLLPGIAIGAMVILALNRVSLSVPPDEVQVFRGLQAKAPMVRALSIGSSLASGVSFPELGMEGHHMWTPASDLFENEYTLRLALAQLPAPRLVIVALTPVSLQWTSAARHEYETRRRHYLMAEGTAGAGVIDSDWRNFLVAAALPLVRHDHWRAVASLALRRLGVPAPRMPTLVQDGVWIRLVTHRDGGLTDEDRRLMRWQLRGIAQFEATFAGAAREATERRLLDTLPRMAALARAHGARIVFVMPPLAPDYLQALSEQGRGMLRDARPALRDHAAREGLDYFDFAEDPALVHETRFFFDSHHLNADGAAAFTRLLRSRLEAARLL